MKAIYLPKQKNCAVKSKKSLLQKWGLTFTVVMGITSSFGATASAYVDYKTLSIPSYKQERDNWCWAASSQMSINYLGGNKTQSQIVNYVKGSVVNEPGTNAEVVRALNYGGLSGSNVNGSLAFSKVASQVKNNQPILAAVSWNNNPNGTGHMFVIRGFYNDTSTGKQDIYYKDPWPTNTTDKIFSYNSFLNNSDFTWRSSIDSIYVR
jgi:hypothetical protein